MSKVQPGNNAQHSATEGGLLPGPPPLTRGGARLLRSSRGLWPVARVEQVDVEHTRRWAATMTGAGEDSNGAVEGGGDKVYGEPKRNHRPDPVPPIGLDPPCFTHSSASR